MITRIVVGNSFRAKLILLSTYLFFILLVGLDIFMNEYKKLHGVLPINISERLVANLTEVAIIVIVTLGFVFLLLLIREEKEICRQNITRVGELELALCSSRQEVESLVFEFKKYIDGQFELWGLSKSEREIGFMLLQGYSLKKIASMRFTSERTIRNQARSVYEKSELGGRHELSAFFLGKLLSTSATKEI